jgi:hypothetical protein
MRCIITGVAVLVAACSSEPEYQCREIPDREAEYGQVDRTLKEATNGRIKASPELEEARRLQMRVDDMVREANEKHGCPS